MTFFELELNSKQQQQIQGEKAQLRQVPRRVAERHR